MERSQVHIWSRWFLFGHRKGISLSGRVRVQRKKKRAKSTVSGSAAFGNLYGDEYGIDSYYYKEKLKTLHDGEDFLHQGGTLRGDYHKTTNYLGMIIDNPLAGAATALRSSATNAITNAVTKFINKLF